MNKIVRPVLSVVLAAAAFSGLSARPAAAPEEILGPIVRRDLLRTTPPVFPPLKRDPFSFQTFGPSGSPGPSPAFVRPFFDRDEDRDRPEEFLPLAPVLRYVGFIRNTSTNVFTAVLLMNGRATAAAEGEAFAPGWKVLRITSREIEVEGPDGRPSVFAFEGERS